MSFRFHRSEVRFYAALGLFSLATIFLASCSSSVRFASGRHSGSANEESRSSTAWSGRTNPNSKSGSESSFEATSEVFSGMASYYGNEFHGRKTSSGERYDKNEFSAAHRTLPFGTMLRVRNLANNRSVIVRINDRGPWKETRVLDLSFAAAEEIGMTRSGTAQIEATILKNDVASGK